MWEVLFECSWPGFLGYDPVRTISDLLQAPLSNDLVFYLTQTSALPAYLLLEEMSLATEEFVVTEPVSLRKWLFSWLFPQRSLS